IALGMAAFEIDLPGYRFGWRQVVSFAAAAAVAVAALPVLGGAANGRWSAPAHGVERVLRFLDVEQATAGPFHTVWLGDPAVLPLGSWQLVDGVGWAMPDRGLPRTVDRWPGSPSRPTRRVADALHQAEARESTRLGRQLAPLGVR